VDVTRRWYDRAASTGIAQMHEMANLPVIAPAILLNVGRRKQPKGRKAK